MLEIPPDLEFKYYDGKKHEEYLEENFPDSFGNFLKEKGIDFEKHIKSSKSCLLIIGNIEDDSNLNYLRNVIGIIQALLEKGATGVLDMPIVKWMNAKEWDENYFKHGEPYPFHHVIILKTKMNNTYWFVSYFFHNKQCFLEFFNNNIN